MKIVLTASTGNVGSRVAQLLIQSGVRPTLLVRNPDKLSSEIRGLADVVQGDLKNRGFLVEATKGADAFFWLNATDYSSNTPEDDMKALAENAAAAISANGIEHTVMVSSLGAEKRGDDFIGALGQTEDTLGAVAKNLAILRPGYFYTNLLMSLEDLKHGAFATSVPLDLPVPWNDPKDIGDIAAGLLLNRSWNGHQVLNIGGPRDLTANEVVKIVSEATGKQIQAVKLTDQQEFDLMKQVGMNDTVATGFMKMSQRIASGVDTHRSFRSTTPSTLEGWAYANLRPLLA